MLDENQAADRRGGADPAPAGLGMETSNDRLASEDRASRNPLAPKGAVPEPAAGPARSGSGLGLWLGVVSLAGIGSVALGHPELAALAVLAGLFAVAHAADVDPAREPVYRALAWLVPTSSALVFATLLLTLIEARLPGFRGPLGLGLAATGGILSLAAGLPRPAHELARLFFRVQDTSHTLRLAARLVLAGALFCVPAALAFPRMMTLLEGAGGALMGAGSLWANLIGLTLVALGGVGFWVRRGVRATLERLGLERISLHQALFVGAGTAALWIANAGAEWVQRQYFPALWESDQGISRLIVGNLSQGGAILLGLSAGIGEEVALRGALQPRFGIFPTSALFAVLHVQYSWFGIGVIFVFGLMLGWLRRRTSTTVAVVVHTLYDILAVLALKS